MPDAQCREISRLAVIFARARQRARATASAPIAAIPSLRAYKECLGWRFYEVSSQKTVSKMSN